MLSVRKKKILYKTGKSIDEKNVPCNTFHSKRYILYLLKLSFLKKKKKIINDQTSNINSLHFSQYHTREKIELERDKQERKKKKEGKKKISRGRDSCVAYSKMAVDHRSLRQNVVTPN